MQTEVAALLEPLRASESEELSEEKKEKILSQRDDVLKKIVAAATVLNAAPEKGTFSLGFGEM